MLKARRLLAFVTPDLSRIDVLLLSDHRGVGRVVALLALELRVRRRLHRVDVLVILAAWWLVHAVLFRMMERVMVVMVVVIVHVAGLRHVD